MNEHRTIDAVACVSCGAIGQHLEGCRFAPKEYRPSNPQNIPCCICGHVGFCIHDGARAMMDEIERLTAERGHYAAGYENQRKRVEEFEAVLLATQAERDRLRAALRAIQELGGKTLFGGKGHEPEFAHQLGANAAFCQTAEIASKALAGAADETRP